MPFKEASFWFGLTIFGTGLFFVIEGDPKRMIWAGIITFIGLGVCIYSVAAHHYPESVKRLPVWIPLLILTWAFLGYDIYDRHTKPLLSQVTPAPELIVKGWGAPPGVKECRITVDGSRLMMWGEKYKVGFVCGIADPTRDKFEDDRITVSQTFSIYPGDIDMGMPFSPLMAESVGSVVDKAMSGLPRDIPKGTPVGVPLQCWYELVLFSKTSKVSDIRRLSDIPRYGGVITSQGFPPP